MARWGDVPWGNVSWGDMPWGNALWGIPGGAGDGDWAELGCFGACEDVGETLQVSVGSASPVPAPGKGCQGSRRMRRVQLSQVPMKNKVLGFLPRSRVVCPILSPHVPVRAALHGAAGWYPWAPRVQCCSLPIPSPAGLRASPAWWAPVGWRWRCPGTPGTEGPPPPCSPPAPWMPGQDSHTTGQKRCGTTPAAPGAGAAISGDQVIFFPPP